MRTKRGPTLRGQLLGQQLRELRETNGMTLDEAAEFLQRSSGTVSRFESGHYPIRRPDVIALLDLYRVSDEPRRAALMKISEEVWQTGWWDGYADAVGHRFIDYAWLESRAKTVRSYEAMLIPGLLQTRDYAKALIEYAHGADTTTEQLAQGLEFRMTRQQVLDGDDPVHVEAILDEAVLQRPIGGATIMRAQLTHLLNVAQRPSIEVRVLPFAVGRHAGLDGSFKVFEMREPYPDDVAYVDTPAGAIYLETPEADRFVHMYDRLSRETLGPAESAHTISAAMEGLE